MARASPAKAPQSCSNTPPCQHLCARTCQRGRLLPAGFPDLFQPCFMTWAKLLASLRRLETGAWSGYRSPGKRLIQLAKNQPGSGQRSSPGVPDSSTKQPVAGSCSLKAADESWSPVLSRSPAYFVHAKMDTRSQGGGKGICHKATQKVPPQKRWWDPEPAPTRKPISTLCSLPRNGNGQPKITVWLHLVWCCATPPDTHRVNPAQN